MDIQKNEKIQAESSFKLHSKRDPRLGRIRGGVIGSRSDRQADMVSSASPFLAEFGTHRPPYGNSILTDGVLNKSKLNVLVKNGRQWKSGPGPSTNSTGFSMGEPGQVNTRDDSKTVFRRAPRAVLMGDTRKSTERHSPGPCDYSPACGYTSF